MLEMLLDEGHASMSFWPSNAVQSTSNFTARLYGSLVYICTVGIAWFGNTPKCLHVTLQFWGTSILVNIQGRIIRKINQTWRCEQKLIPSPSRSTCLENNDLISRVIFQSNGFYRNKATINLHIFNCNMYHKF